MESTSTDLATADVAALPTAALEDGICAFAARLAAATCVFVLAIAELDRRQAWAEWECRSMVHWLTWKCAMSAVTAREHVRVGLALGDLPAVRAGFASGALSYSQARALTRVATPETEEALVGMARSMTASQLERLVRAYRNARTEAAGVAPSARRRLTWHIDDDGSVVGTFRLAPEEGALLVRAVEASAEALRRDGVDTTDADAEEGLVSEPWEATRADALVDVARSYLARAEEGTAGEGAERFLVTVIAERRVLEAPAEEGLCCVEGGGGLAASTARRLACDQPTVTILEDQHGRTLDVGRRTRRINRPLRRALAQRDKGCCYPGCNARRTEAHHVRHWIDGGATSLSNLVSLCSRHHHRHHDGAFRIEAGPGGWSFVRADGRGIPAVVAPPAIAGPPDPGVRAAAGTCTPEWAGEKLTDPSWAIEGLLHMERSFDADSRPVAPSDSHHPPRSAA